MDTWELFEVYKQKGLGEVTAGLLVLADTIKETHREPQGERRCALKEAFALPECPPLKEK